MVDIAKLKAVLAVLHPGTGDPYSADAETALLQGQAENLTEDVDFLDPWIIWRAIVPADYTVLTDRQVTTLWGLLNMGSPIPVDDPNVRLAFVDMFSGKPTLTALVKLQTQVVSHFQKERLGLVRPGNIMEARSYGTS